MIVHGWNSTVWCGLKSKLEENEWICVWMIDGSERGNDLGGVDLRVVWEMELDSLVELRN